ncbi:hypothetical protein GQ53DRAFT_846302 [Thozetella sp. PMI_491]|nr:hypothetical protein GQ53DRAFT_846302 [Thozetella sp. PMI_491]
MADQATNTLTDTSPIKEWRSIVTLIVFVFTNIVVLSPFHIPIPIPRSLYYGFLDGLSALRIISPRPAPSRHEHGRDGASSALEWLHFPMNFVTAPLVADLFLLAILAIGRKEVHDGTVGADNISPIDIMAFFLTLAYIAISIDASGLIRYLAFRVLQWGGKVGHRLFFYLYAFFFVLGSFIGNDPIILSGTAFLAYMTRVSNNITHPRAWIHTQFAIANIASAILVSSNPTNLVLAGAFQIKFIWYTANMVVPVVATAIVLFPFLLYIVFPDPALIPVTITMHELPENERNKKPVNPNIPNARGAVDDSDNSEGEGGDAKMLSLSEIMNPFLDKGGAAFGALIMAATLITLLAINAASTNSGEHPVFWVTVPAAFVMFCWDIGFGWVHRHETRDIARKGRQRLEYVQAERALRAQGAQQPVFMDAGGEGTNTLESIPMQATAPGTHTQRKSSGRDSDDENHDASGPTNGSTEGRLAAPAVVISKEGEEGLTVVSPAVPGDEVLHKGRGATSASGALEEKQGLGMADNDSARVDSSLSRETPDLERTVPRGPAHTPTAEHTTLVSLAKEKYRWTQETFPTVTAVIAHLPFALVPFALAMFVLVQALVTKGWVPLFAYGWDHWVKKTGTVGSVGGMGFLSVLLCNFAGTNIGTTILLSRIIQSWIAIHIENGSPISDRTFWGAVYGMALGVNYGAFSIAFSGSLAGLLWRDILARKHIRVRSLEFARVNLPIIAIAMTVGCAVLVGEIYLMRTDDPTDLLVFQLSDAT